MIFDLHNDLLTNRQDSDKQRSEMLSISDTVIYAVWTSELKDPMEYIRRTAARLPKYAYFSVEDMGFADTNAVEKICSLRPAYCGLTHNADNVLAGGALGSGTLTARGNTVIKRLNAEGVCVDTAHLNRKSFFAVAEQASYLINSHTALESLHSHPRNLTDEQVNVLLQRNGIVGLTAVAGFIGGNSLQDYMRLIDCFVQKFGIDGACIGTDFYGTAPLDGLHSYNDFAALAYRLENLGYTHNDIQKLFYNNAYQYYSDRRKSSS